MLRTTSTISSAAAPCPRCATSCCNQLQETRQHLNQLMLDAIQLAQQVVEREAGYVMAGETNLMDFAELSNVEKLRRLFDAFNEKRDILHLLDQSLRAEGVQIFIGQESGYNILDDCSVVTAPYTLRQRGGRRARRDRPHPHGLRARHSDRGHHGAPARRRLEFPQVTPIDPGESGARKTGLFVILCGPRRAGVDPSYGERI